MADKRGAEGDVDPRPTKRGLGGVAMDAIRRLTGKSSDSDSEPAESEPEGQPVQNLARGHDYSRETQIKQARAIDALFAISNAAEAEAKLRDPKRKLIYKPLLEPTDAEWKEQFAIFRDLLRDKERNVRSILDAEFEEAQRILIEPVAETGIISQGQERNTVEYKEFLEVWREKAKNPKIAEQMPDFHDNLANKLVMLRFGIPIEPITLMNILHSSDEQLWDDPPDDPGELPTVQRIIHSEKPLQILDNYHERAHGYPILRRPKPKFPPPKEEEVGTQNLPVNPHGHHFGHGNNKPIFPVDTDVQMRGGAGDDGTGEKPPFILYGPGDDLDNDEIGVNDCPVDFPTKARILLGYENLPQQPFIIDIYSQTSGEAADSPWHFLLSHYVQPTPGGDIKEKYTGHDGLTNYVTNSKFRLLASHVRQDDAVAPETLSSRFTSHHIYGYRGKLLISDDEDDFLRAALSLLDLDSHSALDWRFIIDIHTKENPKNTNETIEVTNKTWKNEFALHVAKKFKNRKYFVRRGGLLSTDLVPGPTILTLVRLHWPGKGTAYWKVPKDIWQEYGFNQYQETFFSAMSIFNLTDQQRTDRQVFYDGFQGGIGGMDLVEDLRASVVKRIKEATQKGTLAVTITITLDKEDDSKRIVFGARLTGSSDVGGIKKGEKYGKMREEILRLGKAVLSDYPDPTEWKVWHNPESRELNYHTRSFHIPASQKSGGKKIFENSLDTFIKEIGGGYSPCLWFRPEYDEFEISDNDNTSMSIAWQTKSDQTLAGFMKTIGQLFNKMISEPVTIECVHNGRVFVVTPDTKEEIWRRDVFDWFHGNFLNVRLGDANNFILDDTNWGVASRPLIAPHRGGLNIDPQNTTTNNNGGPGGNGTNTPQTEHKPPPAYVPPLGPPRFNKARYTAPFAGKQKTEIWSTWQTEQHRQDDLQRNSYVKDQSVIEPGQNPAAPLYGSSVELELSVSSSFPTIYTQRLTPTDIRELAEENQTLRNAVLDRTKICPICSKKTSGFDRKQIELHYKEHLQQIQECAKCPICETEQWGFMILKEKQDHLLDHQHRRETDRIRIFWKHLQCPICDYELHHLDPEDVLNHMADHNPGVLQYCHRCGLHESECSRHELNHHIHSCLKAQDRKDGDPVPEFCEWCGKDRTYSNKNEIKQHDAECGGNKGGRKFCTQCGLNLTALGDTAVHDHHTHCKPPRGYRKKFCRRCGEDLSKVGKAEHKKACYLSSPQHTSNAETLAAMQKVLQKTREAQQAAHAAEVSNHRREIELELLEIEIQEHHRDTKKNLEAIKKQVKDYEQIKKDIEELDVTRGTPLGDCPYEGCTTSLTPTNRQDLYNHLKDHSQNSWDFICPLNGCQDHLNFAHNCDWFKAHYQHRDKNAPVLDPSQRPTGGSGFDELRALAKGADSDIQEIDEFHEHLGPDGKLHDVSPSVGSEMGPASRKRKGDVITVTAAAKRPRRLGSATPLQPVDEYEDNEDDEDEDEDEDTPPPAKRTTRIVSGSPRKVGRSRLHAAEEVVPALRASPTRRIAGKKVVKGGY